MIEILIALTAALVFTVIIRILGSKGILEKYNFATYGPWLMYKTKRGRNLLKWLAKPKSFWKGYAAASMVAIVIFGVLMMVMILFGASVAFNPSIPSMSLQEVLVIPGVNPIIPLWYGLFGLIIAVLIHEFSHGILTFVGKMKVKSMGILFWIIPIGAFVEPDEEQMSKAKRWNRARVYAGGPGTNIFFGFVCALIFAWLFMGSVSTAADGMVVYTIGKDTPAEDAGIEPLVQIVDINGTAISSFDEFYDFDGTLPNQTIPITIMQEGRDRTLYIRSGLVILGVSEGSSAEKAGLKEGMIIHTVNGTVIKSHKIFSDTMADTKPGQTINGTFIVPTLVNSTDNTTTVLEYHSVFIDNITLGDKYEYFKDEHGYEDEEFKGVGFLGVTTGYMGIMNGLDPNSLLTILQRPVASADGDWRVATANVAFFAVFLPVELKFMPLQEPATHIFEINGPLSILPEPLFWALANIFYYLFWLNLLLGTFNALPAFPLDGGFIFRDAFDFALTKIFDKKIKEELREKIVFYAFVGMSLLIWGAIFWTLLGPGLARVYYG